MTRHAKTFLLAAIVVAAVVSCFSGQFNRYYLGVVIDIGINIILAVSLNLINGHTGQFSLGHGGFMAVGAYTSAKIMIAVTAKPRLFRRARTPYRKFWKNVSMNAYPHESSVRSLTSVTFPNCRRARLRASAGETPESMSRCCNESRWNCISSSVRAESLRRPNNAAARARTSIHHCSKITASPDR